MKTFAAALLMATAQAGWKKSSSASGAPDGAVIVGPGVVNPSLIVGPAVNPVVRVPVATSAYVDVVEERPYTVDASTTKTITDVKKRQEPFHITETRTDTVYTPGTVTKQKDLLVTDIENRP